MMTDCWWMSPKKKSVICSFFFRIELSYQGYNNTNCARWGNLTSRLPPHPPPYVMFNSLLTWCSHKQSGIPSYLLFAAALPEDVFQNAVNSCCMHRCSHAHFLLVQRCITNSWNQINNLNESLSRPKCRINSFPHTPAISSLVTALYVQLQICDPVIMQFKANQVMTSPLSYNKCLSLRLNWIPMLETCQFDVVLASSPALVQSLNLHAKALCVDMLPASGNRRGHTMWPPSDNRKLPSCWQGASWREVGLFWLCIKQEERCAPPCLWESWPVDWSVFKQPCSQ